MSFKNNANSRLLFFLGLIYMVSALFFYVADRYRLPMVVFLIPFSAVAVDKLLAMDLYRNWKTTWKLGFVILPVTVLCWSRPVYNLKVVEATGWAQLVTIYYDQGQYQNAVAAVNRSLAISRINAAHGTPAIIKAGLALEQLGEPKKALELYKKGIQLYPACAMLHNNRGISLYRQNLKEEGINSLKKAIELDPGLLLAYKNLFIIYTLSGNKALAVEYGKKALSVPSQDTESRSQIAHWLTEIENPR